MYKKDTVYQHATDVVDFDFDKKVACVFPDMVHRSIPGYASLLTVLQALFRAEFKNSNDLLIYDLGCSVGGVTLALANVLPVQTHFIGVDISADMLVQYKKSITAVDLKHRVEILHRTIIDLPLQSCNAITINFTLQFLNPDERFSVLANCYKNLKKGGLLCIAEKTSSSQNIVQWHEQFKRNNGYSDLEIAQKRKAIENIMLIDDEQTIIERCHKAGFDNVEQIFHALGFKAWIMKK